MLLWRLLGGGEQELRKQERSIAIYLHMFWMALFGGVTKGRVCDVGVVPNDVEF